MSRRQFANMPGKCLFRSEPLFPVRVRNELKAIKENPIEGVTVNLAHASDIYEWDVIIAGPAGTPFLGGYFLLRVEFPKSYPILPPHLRFLSKIWHPNVFLDGEVYCFDPNAWSVNLTMKTVLLRLLSLLEEPSPLFEANTRALDTYNRWIGGVDDEYKKRVQLAVDATHLDKHRINMAM